MKHTRKYFKKLESKANLFKEPDSDSIHNSDESDIPDFSVYEFSLFAE
jgi:hypothetical protein